MLGPSSPSSGPLQRVWPTTSSPLSLMSGVSLIHSVFFFFFFQVPLHQVETISLIILLHSHHDFMFQSLSSWHFSVGRTESHHLTVSCLHLQHLACCCGRSPPTACPPTPALTCPKCTSCWRKTTVWTDQRAAPRRSTSWWGPVSSKTPLSRIWLKVLYAIGRIFLKTYFVVFLSGWRWNPSERPSFAETHQAFETMFQESSISDGQCCCLFHLYLWVGLFDAFYCLCSCEALCNIVLKSAQ